MSIRLHRPTSPFSFFFRFYNRVPTRFWSCPTYSNFIISKALIKINIYNIYSIYHFLNFFVIVFIVIPFGLFIRVFLNSSITMVNWWPHGVNNLLIIFKTSVLSLKWRILEYICSNWWSILNTTLMIDLILSQDFHKQLVNCIQTNRT